MAKLTALSLALLLLASDASAQTLFDRGPPENRLIHRSLVAVRYNALGLVYDGRIGYRRRLYAHEGVAMRDNFVGGGLGLMLSPAYARVGPYVEIAPASFVTLWGALALDAYFGSFNLLQSFDSAAGDWSDDELERRGELADGDPLKPYSATGLEATLGVDLQAKAGPVLIRSRGRLVYADLGLREGDAVFYDQLYDTVIGDGGWLVTNDLDVAWMGMGNRLVAGLRYTATAPLYGDEHGDGDNNSHRLGPLVAYTFRYRDGARFNAPQVFVLVQWWLDHRFRAGQQTSQALPLIGVGFQFYGDLLSFD
jgi:hypothetical protein